MAAAREYPTRPWVGVGVVVWRDDRVLMVKRGKPPRKGEWSLPGGAQHLGETVADAARREVWEETGMDIRVLGILDVVDAIDRDTDGRVSFHFTLVDVLGEWQSGDGRAGDDVTALRWVPYRDLDRVEMWLETRRVIEKAARQRQDGD